MYTNSNIIFTKNNSMICENLCNLWEIIKLVLVLFN